jgi:CHAT domain-containing protein
MLAVTRDSEHIALGKSELPSSVVEMSVGGRTVTMTLLGITVQSLLEDIERAPGAAVVPDAVGKLLAAERARYVDQGLEAFLEKERRRGRDHLCIVPHGPLHYLPFHLLGAPGGPLAADWIVTTLPNLRLLTRPVRHGNRPLRDLTAIGLGWKSRPDPLPQAVAEARRIAGLWNTEPLLDEAATKAAVIEALESSRRVHIATHGAHHFGAPAFQRLYVAKDLASNGLLHAYEVLSLDLRGLELLTLGACETALGRFDRSDNLRGLPAGFLLAGTAAVIGTLWPAETRASERFFTRLYESIREGRSRLDAFAEAQRATRAGFPQYRDWGPFYLMGQWS